MMSATSYWDGQNMTQENRDWQQRQISNIELLLNVLFHISLNSLESSEDKQYDYTALYFL